MMKRPLIQSMTGFATKTFVLAADAQNKSNVSMSLKTLNSRFFETNCKLPNAISHLETSIIKELKKELHRGYINIVVHMDNQNIFKGNVSAAMNVIENYVTALETIKKKFNVDQKITLDQILQLPNIFTVEDQPIDERTMQLIFTELHDLIAQVNESRNQEGAVLCTDIETRISIMEREIIAIEEQSTKQIALQKKKVQDTIAEIAADENALTEARKNALYLILDKIDIHEEIVRFKSHLKKVILLLTDSNREKGKRLDFTFQELAREINTISAKCSDAEIGSHAINIKVEIEKAREQSQNIV
jgi:uncharacterized protein (TIGR00255 family)